MATGNALVLGLGESGLATCRWLARQGWTVDAADTRQAPGGLPAFRALACGRFIPGEFGAELAAGRDLIVASPGLRPHVELKEIMAAAKAAGTDVVSEIEVFARALADMEKSRNYHPTVIAVTGTNGKTTTTSLTAHLVKSQGKTVRMGGNISPAALDVLCDCAATGDLPDVWVLELSSFQLYLTDSLKADSAAVMNVTQDHLDWHLTMDAYAAAKEKIFAEKTVRVLDRTDEYTAKMAKGKSVTFGDTPPKAGEYGLTEENGVTWLSRAGADGVVEKLLKASDLKIRGRHNATNALCALALCEAAGFDVKNLLGPLTTYAGEPHRVEKIAEKNGILYIDDSKGTNVGATAAALRGFGLPTRRNIVLIAGGLGKGQDFSPLAELVQLHVKAVMLIGRDAKIIAEALKGTMAELVFCDTLEEAVARGTHAASEGDIVMLSPACASMDMFKNYAERSAVFIAGVNAIADAKGDGK